MTVEAQQILREALDLPPVERAELVEEILASFNFPDRQKVDTLWAREAEDRINAYDAGKINTISAKKVFERIDYPRES